MSVSDEVAYKHWHNLLDVVQ